MGRLEKIARSILAGDALEVRSLVQDWRRAGVSPVSEQAPTSSDPKLRAVAAAVLELLAERTGQGVPTWVHAVGPVDQPLYLVKAASRSLRMRQRVERESPRALRKRNVFAPPGYLELL
jgi:hypothetical protein